MTRAPRFQITRALRTGIPELDRDHEELIGHINAIAELEEVAGPHETVAALEKFRGHLAEHFTSEEVSLRAVRYPRTDAHLTHHAEIVSIDGESYRKREAEQAQKRKQEQKPTR